MTIPAIKAAVSLIDFWPPYQPSFEDFYPNGIVVIAKPFSAPVLFATPLIECAQRMRDGAQARIDILRLMQSCEQLLDMDSDAHVALDVYRERAALEQAKKK